VDLATGENDLCDYSAVCDVLRWHGSISLHWRYAAARLPLRGWLSRSPRKAATSNEGTDHHNGRAWSVTRAL
jgi:hypothetical protein